MSRISVVIPAHDEATIIAGALESLRDAKSSVEVFVIANGCTDDTAAVARESLPDTWVIEISTASKVDAINTGLGLVTHYPVAFVDADVSVSGADLVELGRRLEADADAHIASLTMHVLPSRSWAVRQYYRVWELTDYRSAGHIGSGLYMLSASGRRRFERFPDVIADDLFAQRLFAPNERLTAADLSFSVRAPGSLRSLLKRNTRIAAGNRQLAAYFPHLVETPPRSGARSLVRRVARRPSLWAGFLVYCAIYLTAHRRAQRMIDTHGVVSWNRDDTTRTAS